MAAAVQQIFSTSSSDQWLRMPGASSTDGDGSTDRVRRRQHARELAARSKSGTWGPTHSDSDDSSIDLQQTVGEKSVAGSMANISGWFSTGTGGNTRTPSTKDKSDPNCNGTESTKSTKSSHSSSSRNRRSRPAASPDETTMTKQGEQSRSPSNAFSKIPLQRIWSNAASTFSCQEDTTVDGPASTKTSQSIIRYVEDACSPCQPRALDTNFGDFVDDDDDISEGPSRSPAPISSPSGTASRLLGIEQMVSPAKQNNVDKTSSSRRDGQKQSSKQLRSNNEHSSGGGGASTSASSSTTPLDRRRQRHRDRALRSPVPSSNMSGVHESFEVTPDQVLYKQTNLSGVGGAAAAGTAGKTALHGTSNKAEATPAVNLPLDTLTVKSDEAYDLQHSISELTMKSSYAEATAKLAENRRMAYYAVGRHHRNSGRGGNRRCYFTGRLILGGAPFYAGSVQQGLRTLVVFCLPSAIGLPKGVDLSKREIPSDGSFASLTRSSHHRRRGGDNRSLGHSAQLSRPSITRKGSRISRLSSVDDMSLSVEEEMDANYGIDRDYLLSLLPDPSQGLLDEMASRYPAQFETLPVQVRSPHCWRLYVKFCFFSGLPIAEGEMHYKVRDEISEAYGEEIILSHEVMETVNGDSAEILRLPNLKTFRYLKKHYSQQSGKLPEQAFMRQSWEMVRPEI